MKRAMFRFGYWALVLVFAGTAVAFLFADAGAVPTVRPLLLGPYRGLVAVLGEPVARAVWVVFFLLVIISAGFGDHRLFRHKSPNPALKRTRRKRRAS